jgi:hypothetical protein
MRAGRLRGVAITLFGDVSPEMREDERFSTACAGRSGQPPPRLRRFYCGDARRLIST